MKRRGGKRVNKFYGFSFKFFQVEKDFKSKEYFQLRISVTLIAEVIDLNLLLFRLCSIWQVLSAFFRLFIEWAEVNFC